MGLTGNFSLKLSIVIRKALNEVTQPFLSAKKEALLRPETTKIRIIDRKLRERLRTHKIFTKDQCFLP